MRKLFYCLTAIALVSPLGLSAQEYDDIYYNPKKDKTASTSTKKKKSYYIKGF